MSKEVALSREAMRELDRHAIEEIGVPGMVLMENAGRAVAEVTMRLLRRRGVAKRRRHRVVIVCGKGNNGGDGFVAARHLLNRGVSVVILLACREADVPSDTDGGRNYRILTRKADPLLVISDVERLAEWPAMLRGASCVLDALFGTGLDKPVSGLLKEIIELINRCRRPVVAIDVPSGLDCNTGEPLGIAVRADVTVTFAAPKVGFFCGRAKEFVGRLVVADIGIPRAAMPGFSQICAD